MANALSMIIEDFLEIDETFWPEIRTYWSRVRDMLNVYES